MRGSNLAFVEIAKAVRLVVEAAAISPDRVRDQIGALVHSDAIRLRDPVGAVVRFSETPECAAERYARANRPPAARYNPHSYAVSRGLTSRQSAKRSPSVPDWRARYALHVDDLEKALSRELAIDIDLAAAIAEAATPSSSSAGPIIRLVEYFRANGHKPEFDKLPQDRWRLWATKAGLSFTASEFAAAWHTACENGWVSRLEGAPKREQQVLRAEEPPASKAVGT